MAEERRKGISLPQITRRSVRKILSAGGIRGLWGSAVEVIQKSRPAVRGVLIMTDPDGVLVQVDRNTIVSIPIHKVRTVKRDPAPQAWPLPSCRSDGSICGMYSLCEWTKQKEDPTPSILKGSYHIFATTRRMTA